MAGEKICYPGPGCLVEFMHGNSPMLAYVLEEQSGRLRLYTRTRREVSLPANRLLPWLGPMAGPGKSRQGMDELLADHSARREQLAGQVDVRQAWELVQGEAERVCAEWMAGFFWESPDADHIAAMGHCLLLEKMHFRFSPPDFEVYSASAVAERLAAAQTQRSRDALIRAGSELFRALWEVHLGKRPPLEAREEPEEAGQLEELLMGQLAGSEDSEEAGLWKQMVKGLPDVAHMPLFLAEAWKKVPKHHNHLLNRVGYDPGEAWAGMFEDEMDQVRQGTAARCAQLTAEAGLEAPGFVSIDPASAEDRDDAFFVEKQTNGSWKIQVALACPALAWPFGSGLDRAVMRRNSSLYLPEGTEHMLPCAIGRGLFSLDAEQPRPALVVELRVSAAGETLSCEPRVACVVVSANLSLEQSEGVLAPGASVASGNDATVGPKATGSPDYVPMLREALELGRLLQAGRIAAGAVITERPDPEVRLEREGENVRVRIETPPCCMLSHLIVGELMILTNSALAAWAHAKNIPFLYRGQDVGLPREFAGIWSAPHDIARVLRSLPPATLDTAPKRHAGLGVPVYGTASSPIRRYSDLLNQGQIVGALSGTGPAFDAGTLGQLLAHITARQEAVSQIQRFRPRFWKLLFFRQQGDKQWWDAQVADENEYFVTVALPWAQVLVRARRHLFDEKMLPGTAVQVRLGKVNPLLNEIQVLEVREA